MSGGFKGIQINFGINLLIESSLELNFLLNVSYMKYASNLSPYYEGKYSIAFGPMLEFYFYGLHAQLGTAIWSDNQKERPQGIPLYIQVGLVHRFGNK
jgi:hypothetical protein